MKGSEDLGNGLSAIYQFEYGANVANGGSGFSSRETWVGLKGGFGEVRFGNTESPYYTVEGRTDVFITSFRNYALINSTRRSNSLTYKLPGGLPVTGGLQAVMDGNRTNTIQVADPAAGIVCNQTVDVVDEDGMSMNTALGVNFSQLVLSGLVLVTSAMKLLMKMPGLSQQALILLVLQSVLCIQTVISTTIITVHAVMLRAMVMIPVC